MALGSNSNLALVRSRQQNKVARGAILKPQPAQHAESQGSAGVSLGHSALPKQRCATTPPGSRGVGRHSKPAPAPVLLARRAGADWRGRMTSLRDMDFVYSKTPQQNHPRNPEVRRPDRGAEQRAAGAAVRPRRGRSRLVTQLARRSRDRRCAAIGSRRPRTLAPPAPYHFTYFNPSPWNHVSR